MRKPNTLEIALACSLGVHGVLLAWRAGSPDSFNRVFQDTPLEVVLVNTRSNEAPVKAAALAQANLAGGGNMETGRATSPLPPARHNETGDAAEAQHTQIAQLQEQQQQLLTVVRRELALLPPPDPKREKTDANERAQAEKRRQLVELLAEIEKRVNDESARPRKRYVSPAVREVVYAQYYDGLRRRIEERGTRNFPEYRGRKLYGELVMNISVNQRGRVIETEIVASSGNPTLDRRAIAIVQAASPFGNFSHEMLRGAEVLVITSRFKFTRDEGLETTLTGQE
ncbi:energy transducer TonB [Roseateles saccharophilus]|uniref:Protein TonB n=1 Tax=Roseateles saccharophilus TaxID=304 RepID=A0A4R3V5U8_ROSSA|nr:energy transducer TonB [Roseateles saccharophilus]MDG0836131.1 TonB family protein [Roseateles saccharophilus]TCU98773.1 protein TonB [Roseateles saccharophilus]